MVIEMTLGVSKEDSKIANQSDRHRSRWDEIAEGLEKATTNIDIPNGFDTAPAGGQSKPV